MRMREYVRHSVSVTEPVFVNAYTKEKEYLRSLDVDKLLAGFREVAGLPRRADKYSGGWEDKDYSGHTLGHYMVALAQVYAREKSGEIQDRLEYILSELSQSQKQSGFLFTYDEEVFDKLEKGDPYKVWYTMHKIVKGLIAVYKLTEMEQALDILKKLGEWITDRVLNWTDKQKRWTLTVADGGMNDCLYELYKITEDERYAEAAEKFDEQDLFTPLLAGKDILTNKHAADTIPKILGALNRYKAFGESEVRCLETAENFFDMVMKGHTYVTGGTGELMHFRTSGTLKEYRNQYNSETCSTYGMMVLAERLYSVTGDKKYMDYYEQAYFNAMLGAQNPEDGMTAFFQPMAAGYFKTFSTPFSKFWCCTGTAMEMFTDLNRNIYHTAGGDVYVNLYVSSVLEDKESGVKLTQTVNPESYETAEFVLELKGIEETVLYFRLPEWGGDNVEVTINGTAAKTSVKNGYLSTESKHKNGERIVLKFRPTITLHTLPDMEHCLAITYGPFVMAAGLGTEDMTTECMRRNNVDVPTKNVAVLDRIVLQEGVNRSEWIANYKENFVKKDGKLIFTLSGLSEDGELTFIPYYKIYNERYGIYFDYFDEENLPDDLRAIKEEKKRLEEERLAAEAEAARLAEEERLRQEEEERKRQEAVRLREEEERRRIEEEEKKRQDEERKRREEDYRLRRGIELQRQEFQRRLDAEAEERERLADEERKRRAQEEHRRYEEERKQREEEERKQREEEERKQREEEERKQREEEEERRRLEEERLRREEEERKRREEEERRRIEEERRREEEERRRLEEERRREEEERRRLESEEDRARRLATEAEQQRQEEERRRQEEERKRREEDYRLRRGIELQRQEIQRRMEAEAEERERREDEERKRRAQEERRKYEEERRKREEAERQYSEEEERRLREEEERKRREEEERRQREEDYRLRRGIELQRQEMERRRLENDDDRERRETAEAEKKRQEEERKRREEEYRLLREREAQRQEMERRRQEEAEKAELQRQIEEEEKKKREEEEKRRAEEEAIRAEEQQLVAAQRAAQLAEARLREEEARLMLAKLAAERAQIEATMQPLESDAADKKNGEKTRRGFFFKK